MSINDTCKQHITQRMKTLSDKSAEKLQKILSKRFGRTLNRAELEEAYYKLMEFAYALIDLAPEEIEVKPISHNYESLAIYYRTCAITS